MSVGGSVLGCVLVCANCAECLSVRVECGVSVCVFCLLCLVRCVVCSVVFLFFLFSFCFLFSFHLFHFVSFFSFPSVGFSRGFPLFFFCISLL